MVLRPLFGLPARTREQFDVDCGWLASCVSRRCSLLAAPLPVCPAAMPLKFPRAAPLGPGTGARTCSRSRPAVLESASSCCGRGVPSGGAFSLCMATERLCRLSARTGGIGGSLPRAACCLRTRVVRRVGWISEGDVKEGCGGCRVFNVRRLRCPNTDHLDSELFDAWQWFP
jgi:hypothetical protein